MERPSQTADEHLKTKNDYEITEIRRISTLRLFLSFPHSHAATVTYIGASGTGTTDSWNIAPNWDTTSVPTGTDSAIISSGKIAIANNNSTPT